MAWLAQYNAEAKIDFFTVVAEACVRYKFADSVEDHLTCYKLMLRNADKTKGVLRLPNPLAPIPKASIGFDYLPQAAAN